MFYPVINVSLLIVYFLFFARVLGMLVSAPIFGTRIIPPQAKIGFSVVLAYMFYLLFTPGQSLTVPQSPLTIALMVTAEFLLGLLIGFVALLVFSVIQFSGNLIDIMTGMHIASVIDPMTHEQQSLLGQFQYILAVLLFLFFNGHHYLIHGLYQSFSLLPLGTLSYHLASPNAFVEVVNNSFIIGLQLSAPIIAILFLIDFSLGIIAKGVPQMNVFLTGMPLKSLVGFFAIAIALLYFGQYFNHLPRITYHNIIHILRSF